MIQLDNLAVLGMANGAISFFANVMSDLQTKYGTNANGWLNVINDLDDIIYADHLRSLSLDSTDTSLYQSYAIVNNRTHFSDRATVDYLDVNNVIDTANGIISPHYNVILPAKTFSGNITANGVALQTFINNTLDNNNTYIAANVTSSKEYSINNGFANSYTSITSSSFDTTSVVPQLQDASETRLALIKTVLVNNNFID